MLGLENCGIGMYLLFPRLEAFSYSYRYQNKNQSLLSQLQRTRNSPRFHQLGRKAENLNYKVAGHVLPY